MSNSDLEGKNVGLSLKAHSDERKFPCSFPGCSNISKTKWDLTRHCSGVHRDRTFKCTVLNCPYAAKTQRGLNSHKSNVHSDGRPFKCPEKGCLYPGAKMKSALPAHIATHKDKNQECPHENCENRTNRRRCLLQHFKTQHPNPIQNTPVFKCRLCEYTGKTRGNLSIHIKTHILEKWFKCEEPNCNFAGREKSDLKKHKIVHSDEKPFACPFESCDYRSKSKSRLSDHVKSHSEERRYKCELCPYRGKRKGAVVNHLRLVHLDLEIRPFKCTEPECDYASKTKGHLKSHLFTHGGEKKYGCSFPDCDYKAFTRSNVRQHHERVHELEKKIQCGLCGFATKTKSGLTIHLRTHTKEEPYFCKEEGCGYRAKQPTLLRAHEQKYHPHLFQGK